MKLAEGVTEAATAEISAGEAKMFLDLPQPPAFSTVDEERLHRKQRLAASFRLFSKFGFDEGVVGHITARDPEFTNTFWVNPFGLHFSLMRVSDLIRVDHEGKVVEGRRPVNAPPSPFTPAFMPRGRIQSVPLTLTQSMDGPSPRSVESSIRFRRTFALSTTITPCMRNIVGSLLNWTKGSVSPRR
jgi:hypothetical protein